jgi:replicative DNA helicase
MLTAESPLVWEPPAAPEAEAALLGAVLLLDTRQAAVALTGVTEADFTDGAHQLTFTAIWTLLTRNEQPEAIAVLSELRRMGRVSSWPTPSASVGVFLAELVEAVPIPLGYAPARRAVLEAATRRRLHQAAVRLAQAAGTDPYEGLTRLAATELHQVLVTHTRPVTPSGGTG